jgi:uncharacterized damage-inducible protein DinB
MQHKKENAMSTLQTLVEQYLDGPKQLRQAIAGMSREQVLARPVAGKWSTLEVVAHLADFDPILADRMKRVIAQDNPMLVGADEQRYAAALCYHERDLQEELTIIEATRSQLARILRKLPDSALARVGNHTERGPRTLEQLLTGTTNHITHHLKFILEKRQALGMK